MKGLLLAFIVSVCFAQASLAEAGQHTGIGGGLPAPVPPPPPPDPQSAPRPTDSSFDGLLESILQNWLDEDPKG